MAQKLSALPIGAKVKFGKLHNASIVWRVADKNYPGYPNNSITLLSDQIIKLMCFDAREPASAIDERDKEGNNYYKHSNIRQWLNSAAGSGQWYTAQHSADSAPDTAYVYSGKNAYFQAAGFLNGFTANEINALLESAIITAVSNADGGIASTTLDKVFIMDINEAGSFSTPLASSAYAYLKNTNDRRATLSAAAVSNSNYSDSSLVVGTSWDYFLRDPSMNMPNYVRSIKYSGEADWALAYDGRVGLRPACNLSADLLVTDTVDTEGCYTIIHNRPPTTPEYINVPSEMYEGEAATVSWSLSTDPDGNLEGYILEQKVNTNVWEQVYKGADRIYTVPEMHGVTTVQYRVKSYDTNNAMSDYVTSPSITVISNRAPVIDGTAGDLGVFVETPPHFTYVVSDADTDVVNVVEKFDGKIIKEYASTLDAQNAITFDAAAWLNVLNGAHTLEITATDPDGGTAVRTVTFTKNVASIKFEKTVAVEASTMPTRALVNIQGNFPSGCELKVWLCNNGNDSSPTWEDATQNALLGGKFYFNNTKKTAGTWGVKVKVELNRGTATETCFIQSVGANFA